MVHPVWFEGEWKDEASHRTPQVSISSELVRTYMEGESF